MDEEEDVPDSDKYGQGRRLHPQPPKDEKLVPRAPEPAPPGEEHLMLKYWRSKSLPVAYLGPGQPNGLILSTKSNESRDINNKQAGDNNKSISESEGGKGNSKCIKNLARGTSAEQEPTEAKKRSADWRTLQQHYYPEGGWGWIITLCALASHILSHGAQLYLSNVLIQRFNKGTEQSFSKLERIENYIKNSMAQDQERLKEITV